MLLEEIEVDLEFKYLVDHIKWMMGSSVAPELIKFKEKRSHWVLKSDYKMALLLEVDKEYYLSDKIFNYHEDVDSILMADGFDDGGYKTRFTRNELSNILESHNSELTIEDFMVYEGEDNEN